MIDMVIVGFGGHAKSVADSLVKSGKYRIAGYTDVADRNTQYRYFGTDDVLADLFEKGIRDAAIGVGYLGGSDTRDNIVSRLKQIGYHLPSIIDPTASLAEDAVIGEGTFVGKNAVVNANARVGNYGIINSGAIVEHDCVIGDYCHVAIGVAVCGEAVIGDHTLIGANATVLQCRKVGNHCVIGAGSTVLADVKDHTKCFGIVADSAKEQSDAP